MNSARGAVSLATEAISEHGRPDGPAAWWCGSTPLTTPPPCRARSAAPGPVSSPCPCAATSAPIALIPEDAWTPITYPRAIWDENEKRLISSAEVAEVPYTVFASKKKGQAITARPIVRRVRDLNPKASQGQDELFTAWRHHAVLTESRSR